MRTTITSRTKPRSHTKAAAWVALWCLQTWPHSACIQIANRASGYGGQQISFGLRRRGEASIFVYTIQTSKIHPHPTLTNRDLASPQEKEKLSKSFGPNQEPMQGSNIYAHHILPWRPEAWHQRPLLGTNGSTNRTNQVTYRKG